MFVIANDPSAAERECINMVILDSNSPLVENGEVLTGYSSYLRFLIALYARKMEGTINWDDVKAQIRTFGRKLSEVADRAWQRIEREGERIKWGELKRKGRELFDKLQNLLGE